MRYCDITWTRQKYFQSKTTSATCFILFEKSSKLVKNMIRSENFLSDSKQLTLWYIDIRHAYIFRYSSPSMYIVIQLGTYNTYIHICKKANPFHVWWQCNGSKRKVTFLRLEWIFHGPFHHTFFYVCIHTKDVSS